METPQQQRIIYGLNIFNNAVAAYKTAQSVLYKVDVKIHSEFQYCSRAQATILKHMLEGPDCVSSNDLELAINNFIEASSHLLNDIVDLLVSHAKYESMRLSRMTKYTTIDDVYPAYLDVKRIINNYSMQISHSRKVRGEARHHSYLKMAESAEYSILVDYCESIQDIEDNLKKKANNERNQTRRFYASLAVPAAVATGLAIAGIYAAYTFAA